MNRLTKRRAFERLLLGRGNDCVRIDGSKKERDMTHSKLARFFLGSNTERVISFSEVPVFAIPAACSED